MMPCRIGQNIYRLRRKNMELLNQLETNSVLLENKIKKLRHTTRTPKKCSAPSPLKRRHWVARNSSTRVASAMIHPTIRSGACSSDNEETEEKAHTQNLRKAPAKRVKRNVVVSKHEPQGTSRMQPKGVKRPNCNTKRKTESQCYCVKVLNKDSSKATRLGGNLHDKKEKVQHMQKNKCSKAPLEKGKHNANDVKGTCNLEDEGSICGEICMKCLEEARCLLNYSPKSVFLRRTKQRLERLGKRQMHKDDTTMTQICRCGRRDIFETDSENDDLLHPAYRHAVVATEAEPLASTSANKQDIHTQTSDSDSHASSTGRKSEQKGFRSVKKPEQPKEKVTEHVVSQVSSQPVARKHSCKSKLTIKSKDDVIKKGMKDTLSNIESKQNSLQKSNQDTGRSQSSVKCPCKKELGGLCCCEVACASLTQASSPANPSEVLSYDDRASAQARHSASVPVISSKKVHRQFCSGKAHSGAGKICHCKLKTSHKHVSTQEDEMPESGDEENNIQHLKPQLPSEVRSAGYDVIAGLLDNEHKKYTSDPCTHQVEELSHFRQKHWFDCHAHPHGVSSSERFLDSGEIYKQANMLDEDVMQPTVEPCTRAYKLNQRLFPEMVGEMHSADCCVTGLGSCIPPRPLPSQRRFITLPSLPQRLTHKMQDTVKLPLGVQAFPKAGLLICDPPLTNHEQDRPHTGKGSPKRPYRPVPSNSLALRFQKGVV